MGKSANQEYLINDQVIYKITRNFEQNFSQSMLLSNEASSPWKQTYFNQVLDSSRAQMPNSCTRITPRTSVGTLSLKFIGHAISITIDHQYHADSHFSCV